MPLWLGQEEQEVLCSLTSLGVSWRDSYPLSPNEDAPALKNCTFSAN
jgi:hypothetical protein